MTERNGSLIRPREICLPRSRRTVRTFLCLVSFDPVFLNRWVVTHFWGHGAAGHCLIIPEFQWFTLEAGQEVGGPFGFLLWNQFGGARLGDEGGQSAGPETRGVDEHRLKVSLSGVETGAGCVVCFRPLCLWWEEGTTSSTRTWWTTPR